MDRKLFSTYRLGNLELKNRAVMAPMTRSRATRDNIPVGLMAEYYGQRAGAGLIITEGTSPSPNGLGYTNIPGIFNRRQVDGWKKVTETVHQKNGKIFVQLMHTGRIAHPLNLPENAEILAPSAIAAAGQMFTIERGMQDHPTPRAMSTTEVRIAIQEYVQAALYAMEAGFDGVELHGANGYLIEQFLNPNINRRTDEYSGSMENRCRFVLEITEEFARAIGKEKLGIRFSPYGSYNDMKPYEEVDETYVYLAKKLSELDILYLHILDHSKSTPPALAAIKETLRKTFRNHFILCGGFDRDKAEQALQEDRADLIAFGSTFLANPDLVERMESGAGLNKPDLSTFYTPGPEGYTDYPRHEVSA